MRRTVSDFTMIEVHKMYINRVISAIQFKLDTYQQYFATDETEEERTETEEEWENELGLFMDIIASIGLNYVYQEKTLSEMADIYLTRYAERYSAIYLV